MNADQNGLCVDAEKMKNVEKVANCKPMLKAKSFADSTTHAIISMESAQKEPGTQATKSISDFKTGGLESQAEDLVDTVNSTTIKDRHQTIGLHQDEYSVKKSPCEQTAEDESRNNADKNTQVAAKIDDGDIDSREQAVELIRNAKNDLEDDLASVSTIEKRESESPSKTQRKKPSLKRKTTSKEINGTAKKGRFTPQSERRRDLPKTTSSVNGESDKCSSFKKTLRSATKNYKNDAADMKVQADDPIRILITGFDLDNKQKKVSPTALYSSIHFHIEFSHFYSHFSLKTQDG
jgi:hypothetical protein